MLTIPQTGQPVGGVSAPNSFSGAPGGASSAPAGGDGGFGPRQPEGAAVLQRNCPLINR